ncbi:MAG: hypothetical protein A2Y79_14845 [Deltaproteobacteria bacterium RBG_13_43_22]|nr:MAG: hypothetical protein A2Y79_14845 [Deltaproteobacteria bacterium RBG_13_43_22]
MSNGDLTLYCLPYYLLLCRILGPTPIQYSVAVPDFQTRLDFAFVKGKGRPGFGNHNPGQGKIGP